MLSKEIRFGPGEPDYNSPKEIARRTRIVHQILADAGLRKRQQLPRIVMAMTDTEGVTLTIIAQAISDAICDCIEAGHMESREIAARVVTSKIVRDAILKIAAKGADACQG